jgi:CO/xanthine dehydrogenase FAD-binding subunit
VSPRVHAPRTLEELALRLSDGAELFGGGTMLVPQWVRDGAPRSAVTLARILRARQITPTYVGAAVTLDEVVKSDAPAALRTASRSIGTVYLRTQATVGGNLGSARQGCLVTALAGLGARALVLYGVNGREANMSLEEAQASGSVILGLDWPRPTASRYRKVRSGRAGPSEFAVAVVMKDREDRQRVTSAVWRPGLTSPASASVDVGAGSDPEELMAAFPFSSGLSSWEGAIVVAELGALLLPVGNFPEGDR